MRELVIITGIPFISALILKVINILTYKEKENKAQLNLMSKEINYDTYLKVSEQIVKREI